MTIELWVNGERQRVGDEPETPLLWVLRDTLALTGTKYGCGEGHCGACTVLEGDTAVRSCLLPVGAAAGKRYTTIEGLSAAGDHPVQRAWRDEGVVHCGYCQPGMILETVAVLRRDPRAPATLIEAALDDHLCRCGSYPRLRAAAARLGGGR
jgi:isoquinoline 1-oxidoreductase alpha subunit